MARPAFRVIAKPRNTSPEAGEKGKECAVLWPSKFDGQYDLQFTDEKAAQANANKRSMAEIFEVGLENFFFNVLPNEKDNF